MDNASQQQRRELTVGELTRIVKGLVEGEPDLSAIWVKGEASNIRLVGSGHLYFTLKDADSELRVAYFGFGRRRSKPPADGDALLVHGDVRVYEKRGEYQLVADDFIKAGVGDLAAKFEALKKRLQEEGLFDPERKQDLPGVPKKIGIVTGVATAALRDVLNVLGRRAPYAEVVVFPCAVQGDTAPAEIMTALANADACPGVEVILLVRGGGSIEDLWCFNDEKLARVLAEVKRPVISGVGHEIDFTIVDFIADMRAPTPSAAAELVCPDVVELQSGLDGMLSSAIRVTADAIQDHSQEIGRLFDRRFIRDVVGELDSDLQELDDLSGRLAEAGVEFSGLGEEPGYDARLDTMAHVMARELEHYSHVLPRYRDDVLRAGRHGLENLSTTLASKAQELKSRDPSAPKKLGFALVWDKDGKLVRDPKQVAKGDKLRVEVKEGEMDVKRE